MSYERASIESIHRTKAPSTPGVLAATGNGGLYERTVLFKVSEHNFVALVEGTWMEDELVSIRDYSLCDYLRLRWLRSFRPHCPCLGKAELF